jgi:zinc-ribbon domain
MANCIKCGSPLRDDQTFCTNCGQAVVADAVEAAASTVTEAAQGEAAPVAAGVDATAAAAQVAPAEPTPPPVQTPPPGYAPPAYAPGAYQAQAPKKSRKGLWIALAGVVVLIAVACALIFGVFKDQIFGGGSGPEAAVQKLLDAVANKDVDALFEVIDTESLEALVSSFGMTVDDMKDMFADEIATDESEMKFSDVKYKTTESEDGTTATVEITGGKATITEDGETETVDIFDSDAPTEFSLNKVDGKWLIDFTSLMDL